MINTDNYIDFTSQYSISTRATKSSLTSSRWKYSAPSKDVKSTVSVRRTESTSSVGKVYRTKQFSHQKVEYVRKQDKNTL